MFDRETREFALAPKPCLGFSTKVDTGRGPGMIRTCGTWFRKPLLYPLSYGANSKSLPINGFENSRRFGYQRQ